MPPKSIECRRGRALGFEKEVCQVGARGTGRTTEIDFGAQRLVSAYQDYGAGGDADLVASFMFGGARHVLIYSSSKFTVSYGVIVLRRGKIADSHMIDIQQSTICDG